MLGDGDAERTFRISFEVEEQPPGGDPPRITAEKVSGPQRAGQALLVRAHISAETGVKVAAAYLRPAGTPNWKTSVPLTHGEADAYQFEIPPAVAQGEVEYLLVAKSNGGAQVNQGDGNAIKPFRIVFTTSP